ncbi:MAG: thioredoxin-disulfide reductase [Christensenellales bacterium]|jgi:thioredoxin reductase (NADPH)
MLDTMVIGGGPAGLAAALYACRAGLSVQLLERGLTGGQMSITHLVENYPGFPEPIGGVELAMKMIQQAERFGAEIRTVDVKSLQLEGAVKSATLHDDSVVEARTVILAMGARPRLLPVKNERKFFGSGVSYCATCDGAFFRGKVVAIVGGGDTAVGDAIYLSRFVEKVYVVHRRNGFRAARVLVKNMLENEKIEVLTPRTIERLDGENALESMTLKDPEGNLSQVAVQGLFVAIGSNPDTAFISGQVKLDDYGYIVCDDQMFTGIPGVYACGDATVKHLRQIVTAAADGAIAATSAANYLNIQK